MDVLCKVASRSAKIQSIGRNSPLPAIWIVDRGRLLCRREAQCRLSELVVYRKHKQADISQALDTFPYKEIKHVAVVCQSGA